MEVTTKRLINSGYDALPSLRRGNDETDDGLEVVDIWDALRLLAKPL